MKINQMSIEGGYHKYEEVTFMRGFSITTIVLYHLINTIIKNLPEKIYQAAEFGSTGVHVFFFCSGLGLYLSYLNKKTNFREFIKKRAMHIYLPYALAVLLYFFIPVVRYNGNRIGALCSHLFLYKMFIPYYECSLSEHFWFISTLIQFYLLFIPLCKLKEKYGDRVFALLSLGISLIWWIAMAVTGLHYERVLGSCFLQFLWEFCLGMIIAHRLKKCTTIEISNLYLLAVAVIGIGVFGFLGIKGGWANSFNDIPGLFGYGALVLLVYQIKPLRRIGTWLGKISYEWYLLHVLVFLITFSFLQGWSAAVTGLVLSIGVAFVYHEAIVAFRKKQLDKVEISKLS